ncbi:hypothetical protein PI86_10970 [Burkholderia sp. A9]|nr:hypothetical protein PI86_10970 [Burkholderia sp. A9]
MIDPDAYGLVGLAEIVTLTPYVNIHVSGKVQLGYCRCDLNHFWAKIGCLELFQQHPDSQIRF